MNSSGENTFFLSKEKLFIVNGQWIAIMEGESLKERTYNHIAFKRYDGEGCLFYFYDYDNYLFEVPTGVLEQHPKSYLD